MVAGDEHASRGADPSGVSFVSVTAWPGVEGVVVGHNAGSVNAEDVDWLVAHLRVVVADFHPAVEDVR